MAPAWAIHEGRLYVAGWPQIIASVIGRDTAATTITADPCYRKTRSRLHESASILSYVNSPQIARHLYGSALLGWTLGAGMLENQSNIEAGIDWLPSLATLEKYLWVDTTTVSSDARGVTFSSYGSLPMIGLSAVPFGGPVLLAGPAIALQRAKANARKALSQTKLKSIHLAIMLYADDHEGSLPPDLAALGDKYLQSTETFVSPLSDRPPPRLVDGKFGSQIDYIWVGSGNLWSYDKPQEVVLAYERPENYNGKPTLVLFADGQIAFMDAPSLAKALSLSKELTGDH